MFIFVTRGPSTSRPETTEVGKECEGAVGVRRMSQREEKSWDSLKDGPLSSVQFRDRARTGDDGGSPVYDPPSGRRTRTDRTRDFRQKGNHGGLG